MSAKPLPALFIGHGSPMNIIADNRFTSDMADLGTQLPVPKAILVVSAHWLTKGTFITSSSSPEQIYDFFGFPPKLYKFKYLSPGSPQAAAMIIETAGKEQVIADPERGIDHAAWAVLKHIYPGADIPVLELSLDVSRPPQYHFETGQKLKELRNHGILVIGSGNLIHNLREVDFNDNAKPFDWAEEFDSLIKKTLEKKDFETLINYDRLGRYAGRAIPYFDHYLPMLYTLGMMDKNEKPLFVHESIQNGSISMRSFITD
jgi:4,5-DOPA dioxygenase extradiol